MHKLLFANSENGWLRESRKQCFDKWTQEPCHTYDEALPKVCSWTLLATIVTSSSIIDTIKFRGYTSHSNNSKTQWLICIWLFVTKSHTYLTKINWPFLKKWMGAFINTSKFSTRSLFTFRLRIFQTKREWNCISIVVCSLFKY